MNRDAAKRARILCGVVLFSFASPISGAHAQEKVSTEEPEEETSVRGIEKDRIEAGDASRTVWNALLFIPRQTANLVFSATGAVGGLIEDEQVVPRVQGLWSPGVGQISIFPTVFIETGEVFNIGGRLLARARRVASSVRAGYGGRDDLVAESKLGLTFPKPLPFTVLVEAYHERRTRSYRGVGQRPLDDSRNDFNPATTERVANYVDVRERIIASLGGRFFSDAELFFSSSLRWRRTDDASDPDAAGLDDVFLPGTVVGAFETTQLVYSEVTARFDTREQRGAPSEGGLFELYAGEATGFSGTEGHFARLGGRAAAFIPVVHPSNILSPKIVVDGLDYLQNEPPPFTELTNQPDFRGFDNRRDNVSAVGSLDYRWALWKYLAARIFFDVARVAPTVSELRLTHLRWATGLGFDLYSKNAPLGNVAFVGSPEGFRFILHFGVSPSFGDRQHR